MRSVDKLVGIGVVRVVEIRYLHQLSLLPRFGPEEIRPRFGRIVGNICYNFVNRYFGS